MGLAAPTFVAEPVPAHIYAGGWAHFVGGGLAAFDCNGDHLPELYAAGGEAQARLLINQSAPGEALTFVDGTPQNLALTGVVGAYPLDMDSDGILDIMVLRVGENKAFKGLGKCQFGAFDGLDLSATGDWTTAFSATWEKNAVLPTLAFGNYVDRADPEGPFEACAPNFMLRPHNGAYGAPIALTPGFCALSMLFSDWGRKGRADLRVSNDRHYYVKKGAEQLWAMEAVPRLYGAADGWQDYSIWGMGIAARDISGDGLAEVYLTSMGDQKLQALKAGAEGPTYEDATFERGTTAHRPHVGDDGRPSTGWHVAFGDVQNDGRDDIFVTKGNVEQMPGSAMRDPNNLLVQQDDGRFVEAAAVAGLASMARGRGAVLADLNLDGLLDVGVVNRRAPLELYRNVTKKTGAWVQIALVQDAPNVFAIGAFIEVETAHGVQTREVTIGGGHAGGTAGPEHFGLGDVAWARLRVIWPDGDVSGWVDAALGHRLKVQRAGDGIELIAY